MTAAEVITAAKNAGLLLLADGADLVVKPASRITPEVGAMLMAAKVEVIEYLRACERITPMLLTAAMRACDHYGDDEAAREVMRADCLATPMQHRLDLFDHFGYCDAPLKLQGFHSGLHLSSPGNGDRRVTTTSVATIGSSAPD